MTRKIEITPETSRMKPARWVVVTILSLAIGLLLFKVGYSVGAAIAEAENARDAASNAVPTPSILTPLILA